MTDSRLQQDAIVDKKEAIVNALREENIRLRDNVQGKDEAI